MEKLLEECNSVIDEVSEKYEYDNEFKLKEVLKKVVPAMLKDSTQEAKELFFNMLRNTPIEVIDTVAGMETRESLKEKFFANTNPHVKTPNLDEIDVNRKYNKGFYCSIPILNEDVTKVLGKKSFICVDTADNQEYKDTTRNTFKRLFNNYKIG